jgi:hypothetical protein
LTALGVQHLGAQLSAPNRRALRRLVGFGPTMALRAGTRGNPSCRLGTSNDHTSMGRLFGLVPEGARSRGDLCIYVQGRLYVGWYPREPVKTGTSIQTSICYSIIINNNNATGPPDKKQKRCTARAADRCACSEPYHLFGWTLVGRTVLGSLSGKGVLFRPPLSTLTRTHETQRARPSS